MSSAIGHPAQSAVRLLLALPLICACSDGPGTSSPATAAVTLRDSAGITIVENHDSLWTAETRWSIAAEPDLVIGSVDGSVRGTDWGGYLQAITVGERVVAIDLAASTLRVFDEEGVFLRTIAGRGRGPLELQSITIWNEVAGDSVAVWDASQRKAVRYSVETGGGQSVATPERGWRDGTMWFVRGFLADGSFVLTDIPNPQAMEPGRRTLTTELHRFSADGEHEALLDSVPHQEGWKVDELVAGPVVFTSEGLAVTSGDDLWFAFPNPSFELQKLNTTTGARERITRRMTPAEPVSEAMIQQARDGQAAVFERFDLPAEMQNPLRRLLENQQYADSLPPFITFHVAKDGHLWVEPARWNDQFDLSLLTEDGELPPARPTHFIIFDPEGRWLGTLVTRAGFSVTEVGKDYVLGVRVDDLDVPFVERYQILKPQ